MVGINGPEIGGDLSRREDLSFIVRFNWKTSSHLKEAIQLLLASRLDESSVHAKSTKRRGDVLDASEYERIRAHIASNPNTPPGVLSYLSKYGSVSVLERVAENPRTPLRALERLAQSTAPSVRAAVAENVNASPDILTILGTDPDADVRYTLAENPHLPEEMLVALAEDSNPYVSHRANATLSRMSGGNVVLGMFGDHRREKTEDIENVAKF